MSVSLSSGAPTRQVDVDEIAVTTTLLRGVRTVVSAGTARVLVDTSTPCYNYITIRALSSNLLNIYLGGSDVDDTGWALAPGEEFTLVIGNLDVIYIDADNSGEGVEYLGS